MGKIYYFEWKRGCDMPVFSFTSSFTLDSITPTFKHTINLSRVKTLAQPPRLVLQTNIEVVAKTQFKIRPQRTYHVPLLKSALQKCVRRQKSQSAVRIAYQLIFQDINAFIRRLPVIMMEDAVLHRCFPKVVWWMIAISKGWKLSWENIVELLKIVYIISESPYHDRIPSFKDDKALIEPVAHFVGFLLQEVKIHEVFRTQIGSLILRALYGGMKGDVLFLYAFAERWCERFTFTRWSEIWEPYIRIDTTIDIETLLASSRFDLLDEDKISEAIDFHCFPQMIKDVHHVFPHFSHDDIKSSIWYHRSGIYTKIYICKPEQYIKPQVDDYSKSVEEYRYIWNEIEKYVEDIADKISERKIGWLGSPLIKINKITNYFSRANEQTYLI